MLYPTFFALEICGCKIGLDFKIYKIDIYRLALKGTRIKSR